MGATTLVEQHVAAHLLRVRFAEPLGSQLPAGLLVRDGHDQQIAMCGSPAFARQPGDRCDLGGDLRLHVQRSTPPHAAVGDVARPGIVGPFAPVGQDSVHMAEVAERRAFAPALQSGYKVRALRLGAEQLALKANIHKDRPQMLDRGLLFAGRIDGVEADQALKEPRLRRPRLRSL